MKGFLALLLLGVLAICCYNTLRIRALEQEVAELHADRMTPPHINPEQQPSGESHAAQPSAPAVGTPQSPTDLTAQAQQALDQARQALTLDNVDKARASLSDAKAKLDSAVRDADTRALPTVRWLRNQAADLDRRVESAAHQPR